MRSLMILTALILTGIHPALAHTPGQTHAEAAAKDAVEPKINIRRQFVDSDFGQLHMRIARPAATAIKHQPLILFHPTPYSSQFFLPFMERMAKDRIVIAIDTPGYGDSARPSEPQSIAAYAKAMLPAIRAALPEGKKFDLIGYHTGCLIAAEVALQMQEADRLLLAGMPYFTGSEQKAAYDSNAKPGKMEADGSHLTKKWDFTSMAMKDGLPIETAQSNFADSMQSYPHDWWAYHGVFTYDGEKQLPKIRQQSLLVAISGSLFKETEAASKIMPNAKYMLLADIERGLFDLFPGRIETVAREFLDQ